MYLENFFWLCHVIYRILVPQPGIISTLPAVEAQSLNHWTDRKTHCLHAVKKHLREEWRLGLTLHNLRRSSCLSEPQRSGTRATNWLWLFAGTYTRMCTHVHQCACIYMHIHIFTHVYTEDYRCVCTGVYVHTLYIYYIYTVFYLCVSMYVYCLLSHFSRVQLCDAMDCSPSGSSVHGILQARTLEWVAISISRGSSRPRD